MSEQKAKITVYYDGACPSCVRDRENYEKMSRGNNEDICWYDITDRGNELLAKGIDPKKALTELHIEIDGEGVLSELDAYIVLMSKVTLLKPLAWFVSLPVIRSSVSRIYHWQVERRLRNQGRL